MAKTLIQHDDDLNYAIFEYGVYNSNRYSRPWGAIVTFDAANKTMYDFTKGRFLGDNQGGEVWINIHIGDIIATGQKDCRKDHTVNDWYIVGEGYELTQVHKAEALHHWHNK